MKTSMFFSSQHSSNENPSSTNFDYKSKKGGGAKRLSVSQIEKQFKENIEEHQLYSIRMILLKISIILVIFLISVLVKSEGQRKSSIYYIILAFSINVVYGLMFGFFKKRFRSHVETLAGLYLTSFSLIIIEIFREDMENFDSMRIFAGGVFISYTFSLCLISKLNWKMCLLILLVVNCFIFARLNIMLAEKVGYNIQITIVLTDLFLFFTLLAHKLERAEFLSFSSFQKNLQEVKTYKKLIEEEIPNQMIIFKPQHKHHKERVLLANYATKKFFNTYNDELILDRLKKLSLISDQQEPIELGDLIYKESYSPNDDEFVSYHVVIENEGPNSLTNPRTKLDLKIGRLKDSKEESVWVVIISDISLVDRLDEMQILQDRKDQMLATVSHDFRTPITGIINLLELAIEEKDDKSSSDKRDKYLRIAIGAAQSLLFLVNDILDIAQISKGKLLSLIKEPVRIGPLISKVIGLLMFTAKKRGIQLVSEFNYLEEIEVLVDPNRLQQILSNLLGNAIKFTEAGSVTISLNCDNYMKKMEERVYSGGFSPQKKKTVIPLTCLVINIKDTGIGIKEKDIPALFQDFGKMEIEKNRQGIGLGLSISQRLAKLLTPDLVDGGIKVVSKEGKGSHFWFPIEMVERDFNASYLNSVASLDEGEKPLLNNTEISNRIYTRNEKSPSKPLLFRKKVLIVDDDAINLLILRKLLEKEQNLEFESAVNGKEAIQKVEFGWSNGYIYPLIIMDLNMPIIDGLGAADIIYKNSKEKLYPTPSIIILTAGDKESIYLTPERQNIKEALTKPLSAQKLKGLLDNYFREVF